MYIGRKYSIAARCACLPASSRAQRQCERSATVIHPSSANAKPNPPLQLLNVSKSLFILHSSSSTSSSSSSSSSSSLSSSPSSPSPSFSSGMFSPSCVFYSEERGVLFLFFSCCVPSFCHCC